MSQLDDYRADHLIVLVGGNPLPNAVSGHLLAKPGGRVTLIYSEGSLEVARRLADWLRNRVQVTVEEVDERSCVQEQNQMLVYHRVQAVLDQYRDGVVGLNYTGGTKAMAVHAYRAVEQWAAECGAQPSFSYLDARTHKIIFDSSDWLLDEVYVGDRLTLTLDEMLTLHGWQLKSKPHPAPILPKTAIAIANAYVNHGRDKDQPYQLWKEKELYPKCKKSNRNDKNAWKNDSELKQIKLTWPGNALSPIADALKEETGQHSNAELDIEAARRATGLSEPGDFCKWLDGIWLEHRVLHALHNLPDELRPQQAFQGVNVAVNKGNFDLDVVTIFGYQLFGFTCGTATGQGSRSELKLKLFEGLSRTRQIGGDQARTALVCVYEDPDGLQAEARQQIDPDGQIRVFGLKHLANLEHELAHWIRSQRKQP